MFTPAQLVKLKVVLDADVPTYGALSDQDAAVLLNTLSETRIRSAMSGSEIAENIDAAEYAPLTDTEKSVVLALCAIDSLSPVDGGLAHQTIASIFGAGATADALTTARSESISPATEADLPRVRADYVRIARTL